MNVTWDELDGYGLSGRLWRKFALPAGGKAFDRTASGNPVRGFFDHFEDFDPTTLTGGYVMLATSGTIVQIPDTGNTATTGMGLVEAATDGSAYDELIMTRGSGLSAAYKFDKDLCFEARFTAKITTAAKYSMFVGLSEIASATTNHLFADAGTIADYNHCGFCHLVAEDTDWDAYYKANTETAQDGATKTKLNALHEMTALTYVKLGFRYQHHPRKLEFYVNGALTSAGSSSESSLNKTELDAATFPDDVFLTPTISLLDVAGDTACGWTLDWMACAQAV